MIGLDLFLALWSAIVSQVINPLLHRVKARSTYKKFNIASTSIQRKPLIQNLLKIPNRLRITVLFYLPEWYVCGKHQNEAYQQVTYDNGTVIPTVIPCPSDPSHHLPHVHGSNVG
jgi:hypothetical protein